MADGYPIDDDDAIFREVVAHAIKSKKGVFLASGELAPPFENYLKQLVLFATGEDAIWESPDDLLDRAVQSWNAGAKRTQNTHTISLEDNGESAWNDRRLVLNITTDDRPFLVDSISSALSEAGKPVSFFANAVVEVCRGENGEREYGSGLGLLRESIIHAEMEPAASDAELSELESEITLVLNDVSAAVDDWEAMRARLGTCIAQLERSRPKGVDPDEHRESIELLKWLWDNRFAFLGARQYEFAPSDDSIEFRRNPDGDLGIMRDQSRRILKSTFSESGDLSPAVRAFMESDETVIVAKANSRSLVHRRVHMDYVGVKSYSLDGTVIGEDRFVGLFTAEAYNRPATDIPLIRSKIKKAVQNTAFLPGGHNEKALINILETYPRDELFQVDADHLRETSLGILRLFKRPRVKLFYRRDRFDRFVSALVYIPRDRFSSGVRQEIGRYLAETFEGHVSAFSPSFGDAALVRVHFIIGIQPGAPAGPGLTEMTRSLRKICRDWDDDLFEELRVRDSELAHSSIISKYADAFDAGYREHTDIGEAITDIGELESLSEAEFSLRAFRRQGDHENSIRLKIYKNKEPLSLSGIIPTLEKFGLTVLQEAAYFVRSRDNGAGFWIHDFLMRDAQEREVKFEEIRDEFEVALTKILKGRTEDDGFNALILASALNWREVAVMRAVAKYCIQTRIQYSQQYIEEALSKYPLITRKLIAVFHARFNPEAAENLKEREKAVAMNIQDVIDSLADVQSLDDDRIIRRYVNFFSAALRTNFFQVANSGGPKRYISFKIDSAKITKLPEPHPYREIFVSGPKVDGVHLRFGPVARGGLRWSDRREDFRTEVLGLVKAQRVKNAVIVPNGSKGGFYPKQLPLSDDRAEIYEAGRSAYKEFIRGILDLTDNIVEQKIVSPSHVVCWDDPDPYLVVAADKGTAQFSDTANEISQDYNFWLGDAFASGGSAGYDHKKMGITARGAWEAVKRHFREMGKDIQNTPFTAAGVGDMSGDVFGNGMLLSEQTKLIAAFDHRDIFLDPNPDPEISYKERKRLFELPRSSWRDYDEAKISVGGGVFSRTLKSIPLSEEIQSILGVELDAMTPNELIKAINAAPVELFWLGGIGTYFKAPDEEHFHAGDRANDAVRIDADQIRAKVIGEGANLGLTQRARILFARNGGRINTDAIDNSAGVDSSDHEVNIKILLSDAIERAALKREDRDALLSEMTEDVASYVLRHNYEQTRSVTQLQALAPQDIESHVRFVSTLEGLGRLDRELEFLPTAEEFGELKKRGEGLTRPELSVLLAYSKLWLFDELVASEAPDDTAFEEELFEYFPRALHEYSQSVINHRLRREIIATRLSNEIVDTCGITFAQRAVEMTGGNFAEIALAYEAVRRIFELGEFASAINALDNIAPASLQTDLYVAASSLLREQVYRLVASPETRAQLRERGLQYVADRYRGAMQTFTGSLNAVLPETLDLARAKRKSTWLERGAPDAVAETASRLPLLERSLDIIELAETTGWSNPAVAGVYFMVGQDFGIAHVRNTARQQAQAQYFDTIATRQLTEELASKQRRLSERIIRFARKEPTGAPSEWIGHLFEEWRAAHEAAFARYQAYKTDLALDEAITVGKLSLLSRKLAELDAELELVD
ncbi:MAG: NAD-glutamate dehydrogenase [Pseudomonadota bacterium]